MKIIDSSAIIKFFSKEPGWELVEKHLHDSVTISLALEELGNALWKKVIRKEIALKNADLLLTLYQSTAELVSYKEHSSRALEIAVQERITFYDSLFLAVALKCKCSFVTCDMAQAKIARRLGIDVTEC